MRTQILNIKGSAILSKENQKAILGGRRFRLGKCGCSCRGTVTGGPHCGKIIQCPQVIRCEEEF